MLNPVEVAEAVQVAAEIAVAVGLLAAQQQI